jgi:hypothetical protein
MLFRRLDGPTGRHQWRVGPVLGRKAADSRRRRQPPSPAIDTRRMLTQSPALARATNAESRRGGTAPVAQS